MEGCAPPPQGGVKPCSVCTCKEQEGWFSIYGSAAESAGRGTGQRDVTVQNRHGGCGRGSWRVKLSHVHFPLYSHIL